MGDSLSDDEAENEREEVNTDLVVGYESEKIEVSYNKRDLLLYALGIGCRNKAEEIFYTFEEHDSFQAFPTFPVVLPFKGTETDVVPFPSPTLMSFPPGLPIINPALILHAEEAIEIFQDLDIDGGHFTKMNKIIGLYDKGKGALLKSQDIFRNEQNEVVCIITSSSFFRGLTGFQSKGPPLPEIKPLPERKPDIIFEEYTTAESALLYRLSGDYNTLHADINVANSVGFTKPILHGLCTFGYAARAILKTCCYHYNYNTDNNENEERHNVNYCREKQSQVNFETDITQVYKLKSFGIRFSKPTYPGETLVTSIWKINQEGTSLRFITKVKDRNVIVLDHGIATLCKEYNEYEDSSSSSKL